MRGRSIQSLALRKVLIFASTRIPSIPAELSSGRALLKRLGGLGTTRRDWMKPFPYRHFVPVQSHASVR
jgi:hypothetical protein